MRISVASQRTSAAIKHFLWNYVVAVASRAVHEFYSFFANEKSK